jgi:hypothetical protein
VPPCGPILINFYNQYATIGMGVVWAVFGVLVRILAFFNDA